MASIGRRGWRQAKTSLTTKFDRRVTLPLADVLERVTQLQAQVAELTEIIKVQVETSNQTTELLGRLLATASGRLESVEETLRQVRQAETTAPTSSEVPENLPREKVPAPAAPGDPSRR